jgi:hypothetical protein
VGPMSNEFLQYRILPNNGSGWYWEVVTTDREVIAEAWRKRMPKRVPTRCMRP